jgi:hypothetical protein
LLFACGELQVFHFEGSNSYQEVVNATNYMQLKWQSSVYDRYPIFNVNSMMISGIQTIFQYYKMGMLLLYTFEINENITKFYVITKTMEFFYIVITQFNGCE